MDLTHEDVQNILKIIDSSSLEELHLEIGDFKLIVRKRRPCGASGDGTAEAAAATGAREAPAAVPAGRAEPATGSIDPAIVPAGSAAMPGGPAGAHPPTPRAAPARSAAAARQPQPAAAAPHGFELKAPMVGTFYRAPAPGAPPFVEEGSVVQPDDTVCIIEVMKLMNSIKAGRGGRVAAILAEDGTLVEYGQTLMIIEPLGATGS